MYNIPVEVEYSPRNNANKYYTSELVTADISPVQTLLLGGSPNSLVI